jgi:hypothetical protein
MESGERLEVLVDPEVSLSRRRAYVVPRVRRLHASGLLVSMVYCLRVSVQAL